MTKTKRATCPWCLGDRVLDGGSWHRPLHCLDCGREWVPTDGRLRPVEDGPGI